MKTTKKTWSKKFLDGLMKVKQEAENNEKANPAYWNGDDWGSYQGVEDADEWIDGQLIAYIEKHVKPIK